MNTNCTHIHFLGTHLVVVVVVRPDLFHVLIISDNQYNTSASSTKKLTK